MSKKIKVNIPGFGERYCSNDVEYKLLDRGRYYVFYKKGTYIYHNEYGPSKEWKDGRYQYNINNLFHRLVDFEYFTKNKVEYSVIGECLGYTKEEFIKNLANTLIPSEQHE